MTTRGRQYPDGPLLPPPGTTFSRLPDCEGWPDSSLLDFWPEAAGEVLHNLLGGGDPEPGPPYTHTLVPPEPIGELEDGTPVYPEPGPAFTLTTGPAEPGSGDKG